MTNSSMKFEIIQKSPDSPVEFNNFDELKKRFEEIRDFYLAKTYTNYEESKKDKEELETIKNAIKEVEEQWKNPYEDLQKKLDKLYKIIQEAVTSINKYQKEIENEQLKNRILDYAYEISDNLEDYKEKVLKSQAFIEEDWLKSSKFTEKKWKEAVQSKINEIARNINTINAIKENSWPLLAHYFETLSMDSVKSFEENIMDDGNTELDYEEEDTYIGSMSFKVKGKISEMHQLMDLMDFVGLDYEIEEDNFPKEAKEVLEPIFDSYVAIDTENSGNAKGESAELTEIGAVKVVHGQIVEEKDWLINPGRPITKRNERLTRISDDMVKDMPMIDERLKEFKEFIGELPLVGHNIKAADLRFIKEAGKKYGIALENEYFDTNKYIKKFKTRLNLEDTKLEHLAAYFGIEDPGHHRADNDARVNALVYEKLKELK